MSSTALADGSPGSPRIVRGETIYMRGHAPPVVDAKPAKDYARIAPHYSDYAVEHDIWTRAWLLLDINDRGSVTRVKLLKHPGANLDAIAIETGMKLEFEPALDGHGDAIPTQMIWPIEWPSYWYMVEHEGIATRIPDTLSFVPCRGSGPLHLNAIHPVYRDCSPPPLAALYSEPWVTK